MIKHISFDFWDTLYTGNPSFRKLRADFISKQYGCSIDEVNLAVKKTKQLCDGFSEKTMCCVDDITQNWHLLNNLGFPSIGGAKELSELTHNVFLSNPPRPLYSIVDLQSIKDMGISISITCNTGLISGYTIGTYLKSLPQNKLFDFKIFSDDVGYFKPNPMIIDAILSHRKCNAVYPNQILHVGDNLNTDGFMCQLTNTNFYNNPKGTLDFSQIFKLL